MIGALCVLATLAGLQEPVQMHALATVKHPAISEMSGIVPSSYPGVFWVHNDSGDAARFFAIKLNGTVVAPAGVSAADYAGVAVQGAKNVDWEDIEAADGKLYLADMGNNGNARKEMGIYVVPEPNPEAATSVTPLQFLPVSYPDQKEFPPAQRHFDCEAVFLYKGKLYFITKHRAPDGQSPETGANLYRLDTGHTEKPNVLKKVDSVKDLGGWVTAADLSPSGKMLAVLTQYPVAAVHLFRTPRSGDRFLSQRKAGELVMQGIKQAEAICWADDSTLLITNEQREIFRVHVQGE
jgi:hypothetical protein